MPSIVVETRIDAPVETCFDLARDVDAHVQSSAFTGERVVEPGKLHGLLEQGDLVCFEARHLGIRQRLCARITEMERPRRFVDEMVRGAFLSLRHVHEFTATAGGGTVMVDTITWKSPFGLLGSVADAVVLKRHMRWFITTKQQFLKRAAEGVNA